MLYTPMEVPVAATPAQAEGENGVQQGRRKRRRRARSFKNREDAESQRMTHIAVERNRRRQMNEYLAVLRSLMPESYVHRGDQASIVSGAIDFVKELEQQLQSLEAQKRSLLASQQQRNNTAPERDTARATARTPMSSSSSSDPASNRAAENDEEEAPPPFARFFRCPQYVWRHAPPREDGAAGAAEETSRASGLADIEASVVMDGHASLRAMAPRRPGQLLKMLAGMQALGLAVLHLNVTTALDAVVLYTLNLKVEEGCSLTTADDIAAAAHHVLCAIDAEATGRRGAAGALASAPHR
ncbi:transcription factor bHLH96-like [Phragmites australis]|uniref:transcription factor bHLH96-like n=1 Tax=Phragmites australis TaxID=29695 RepID=UPI002D78EEA1|nr:transcription factor bHLH96-like [Phragmites australis]XP_062224907.1 transcription factor bHLH96-like [Phragmites australis]